MAEYCTNPYDWSTPESVTLTITESDTLQPGGYLTLAATTHVAGGSAVHGEWKQTSKSVSGLIAVAMMRFIGPRLLSSYYKKVYDGL